MFQIVYVVSCRTGLEEVLFLSRLSIRVNNHLRSLLDHTLDAGLSSHTHTSTMATRKRGRAMVLVAIIALVCTASTSVRAEQDEFGADIDDGPSSSAPPPSSSGATEMTGDELAGSIHSGADVVPHLVKFYAPWCSKCRQMSSDFDAAADRLTRGVNAGTNKFVVASVAEASTGARKLFEDLEIKAYPHVAMFYKGKVFTHAGKDRTSRAFVAFAERDFAKYPSREFVTSIDAYDGEHVTIRLAPKPWHREHMDRALMFIMYMRDDLRGAMFDHSAACVALFFTGLIVGTVALTLTDLVAERLGVPRRGETWDDFKRRTDWEAHREAEKRKAAKKEAKAE